MAQRLTTLQGVCGVDYNVITRDAVLKLEESNHRIRNSRGVQSPKVILTQAKLPDEVELHAEPGKVIIRSVKQPRAGWAEAARRMREQEGDKLLDRPTLIRFDQEEWGF